nr:hypothetical protein [Tanacetum cinerariifolium]
NESKAKIRRYLTIMDLMT